MKNDLFSVMVIERKKKKIENYLGFCLEYQQARLLFPFFFFFMYSSFISQIGIKLIGIFLIMDFILDDFT